MRRHSANGGCHQDDHPGELGRDFGSAEEVATVVADTPLTKVAKPLGRRRISGVPVLDGEEHVVGV
ncbi:hypothetical protein GCM10009539_05570 [Cryptosporangium japonicum]|uniref:CBS domain-containing protein n=1 Tax=Cryptosporangium japonicum TaxID=80872 RepID=A0ABN0TJL0_9ACTN